ncbi:MAG: hypothetical protein A3H02_01145 [Candidatus Niyogibacteria bacterium RIFCSPLOWO2_12_FULL_41_13]|uniref:TrbC/VIRB2 family protein n=1 Tax=Candidatus Niyogibacteria bacterium RIFCSPLOWO2_12_FULL_41_13 TaxID=1801726 RepID=A0A1G2F3I8_9BACT|nr:MAG: hypothetical protein A3H02_01145 [Candidatus Niyogibacteria bacterium RIFCSPLOWO2_12_FULL_41_13]
MKSIPKILFFAIIISIIIITGGTVVDAAIGATELENPIEAKTFAKLVQGLADIIIKAGVPLVGIFIIYAGFMFVTAGGDEKKLETAKTTFYWTMIGAAVLLGSKVLATAIVDLVEKL